MIDSIDTVIGISINPNSSLDARVIAELIEQLGSSVCSLRQKARQKLVKIGRPVVSQLIGALHSDQPGTCWEAAMALGEIRDPDAATALVEAMRHPDRDVSWVASESLVSLGYAALVPVLKGVLNYARFERFRVGASHFLNEMNSIQPSHQITSVLDALAGPNPEMAAPVAAERSLLEFVAAPLNSLRLEEAASVTD